VRRLRLPIDLMICAAILMGPSGCGAGGGSASGSGTAPGGAAITALPTAALTAGDVRNLIAGAVTQAVHDGQPEVIAVVDREGNVLGVFAMTNAPALSPDGDPINALINGGQSSTIQIAIEKARTAAFLSSDQNAFSTRTALEITQSHFPPGVVNAPPGPLFGLQYSSLPCGKAQPNGNGLTGALGGIPVYVGGALAGGIGADATGGEEDEVVALAGADGGYVAPASIVASNVLLDGIRLDWIGGRTPGALSPIPFGVLPGMMAPAYPLRAAPPVSFPQATLAGVPGELRFPIVDSPMAGGLTAGEVTTIVTQALAIEKTTRSALRLPIELPVRMQVGVTDLQGNILGVFRTNDATMFSLDIVVQKGLTVTAFSDPAQLLAQQLDQTVGAPAGLAITTRTTDFLAQPFYPPGIDGTAPGPLYQIQQQLYARNPTACLPSGDGLTVFPGSVPLFKNGALVGGLGVSGDGVDQDDYVTYFAAQGFLPPPGRWASTITYRGTPLPFLKFPRQPNL